MHKEQHIVSQNKSIFSVPTKFKNTTTQLKKIIFKFYKSKTSLLFRYGTNCACYDFRILRILPFFLSSLNPKPQKNYF